MTYIQSEESPHRKRVVLFFVPFLKPNEERVVTIRYRWPGMFESLRPSRLKTLIRATQRLEEPFEWQLEGQSVDPIDEALFEVYASKEVGSLGARPVTTVELPAEQKLERGSELHTQWKGWVFKVTKAAPQMHSIRVWVEPK